MRTRETRYPEVSDHRAVIGLLGPRIIVQNHPANRKEVGIVRDQDMVDFILGGGPRIEGRDGRNVQCGKDMRVRDLPHPVSDGRMDAPP